MRFGIDVGTTRTVIAVVDRGNYPVIPIENGAGDSHDFIPSVVALDDAGAIICGWDAVQAGEEAETFTRSFKRALTRENVTGDTLLRMGSAQRPLSEVLGAFAEYVVDKLRDFQRSVGETSPIAVSLGVPANAHSAQRLLTLDAFARTGITVLGLINEPSAAAFEYTHRHSETLNTRRNAVVVYDLGGGTFDASLIEIDGRSHRVRRSLGISRLGGDDFDEALVELALEKAGKAGDAYGARAKQRLLNEARTAKEAIVPQTRRMVLDVEGKDVTVSVADFYQKVMPLVFRTLEAMRPLIGRGLRESDVAGVYVVGGAAALPLISRTLREDYGHRVHRSPLPTASTAVGLALAADPEANYEIEETLSRNIGVFREWEGGERVSFDALVTPDTAVGDGEPVTVRRQYRAAHNVGWFRFVEYGALSEHTPGDLSLLAEMLVPFDAALRELSAEELAAVPVERRGEGPMVYESITVDGDGIASIRIEVPEIDVVVESSIAL